MPHVETRYAIDPQTAKSFDTQELRNNFHVDGLFVPRRTQARLHPL